MVVPVVPVPVVPVLEVPLVGSVGAVVGGVVVPVSVGVVLVVAASAGGAVRSLLLAGDVELVEQAAIAVAAARTGTSRLKLRMDYSFMQGFGTPTI